MLTGSVGLREAAADILNASGRAFALVFGNEGAGLSEEFAGMGTAIRIEQTGLIDSLNLAAAVSIAMYQLPDAAVS
jgi:tRNA G18 (ribose-2'-O)-methylase SpoU